MSREEVMRLWEVIETCFLMLVSVILFISTDSVIVLIVCWIVAIASYIYLNIMIRKWPEKDKR